MREILFRGQRTDNKGFIYGSLEIDHKNRCFISYWVKIEIKGFLQNAKYTNEVKPETFGQFIGIKDKDGTDVYEGDLISFYGSKESKQIMYSEDGRLVWKTNYGNFTVNSVEIHDPLQIKVTGNIHENPELLK